MYVIVVHLMMSASARHFPATVHFKAGHCKRQESGEQTIDHTHSLNLKVVGYCPHVPRTLLRGSVPVRFSCQSIQSSLQVISKWLDALQFGSVGCEL